MTAVEWIAAANGLAALYGVLQASKPAADTLTPEEKARVDEADMAINAAVAGWDAT